MYARGVAAKWQSRRKISLGPVRRACPASGASWNVQIVRGKMTSRCLWHACRALALGLVLMIIGAGMATIGYYAEHISPHTETRNNSTIRVKTDSKGIHLHNLSYAGPIVMGCGGFIIVAACVMTFEARDSAAKVVPARFKLSTNSRANGTRMNSSRRTTASGMSSTVGSQTTRWDNQLGVFRTSPGETAQSRVAQTAALVHFSKIIGSAHLPPKERRFSRSGSVPNLSSSGGHHRSAIIQQHSTSPTTQRIHSHHRTSKSSGKERSSRNGSRGMQRTSLNKSIDEAGVYFSTAAKLSIDSQQSFGKENAHAMFGDFCANKRDRTKRSDTAKRHILARQKQIDGSELQNANGKAGNLTKNRSNSTTSDISNVFRKGGRKSLSTSRTPSVDSRGVQTDEIILDKGVITSPSRKSMIAQTSTPSVEGKFKSQLSVCSEPANLPPYQLSIDQSLPEELPKPPTPPPQTSGEQAKRPTSLVLKCNRIESTKAASATTSSTTTTNAIINEQTDAKQQEAIKKILYRSNSSSLHKRPSSFVPAATTSANDKFRLSSELDKIFVISSNRPTALTADDENYDSIEVIDERRMKNMPKSDRARLYKSNTFICEEYYTNEQLADVIGAETTNDRANETTNETTINEKRD